MSTENLVHINTWKRHGENEHGEGCRGCDEFSVDIWLPENAPLTSDYWMSVRRRFCGGSRSASETPAVSNLRLCGRGNTDNDNPGSSYVSHSMSEGDGSLASSRGVCLSHAVEL